MTSSYSTVYRHPTPYGEYMNNTTTGFSPLPSKFCSFGGFIQITECLVSLVIFYEQVLAHKVIQAPSYHTRSNDFATVPANKVQRQGCLLNLELPNSTFLSSDHYVLESVGNHNGQNRDRELVLDLLYRTLGHIQQ